MANSVCRVSSNEPSHLDLHSLYRHLLLSTGSKRKKKALPMSTLNIWIYGKLRKISIHFGWKKKRALSGSYPLIWPLPLSGLIHQVIFFLFFPESRIWHFMQIVSNGDNLHEMSNLFSGKNTKNISMCLLLKCCLEHSGNQNGSTDRHNSSYPKYSPRQTWANSLDPDQSVPCLLLFVLRFYGPVNPMGSCRGRYSMFSIPSQPSSQMVMSKVWYNYCNLIRTYVTTIMNFPRTGLIHFLFLLKSTWLFKF